jgi:hypothetical protein
VAVGEGEAAGGPVGVLEGGDVGVKAGGGEMAGVRVGRPSPGLQAARKARIQLKTANRSERRGKPGFII